MEKQQGFTFMVKELIKVWCCSHTLWVDLGLYYSEGCEVTKGQAPDTGPLCYSSCHGWTQCRNTYDLIIQYCTSSGVGCWFMLECTLCVSAFRMYSVCVSFYSHVFLRRVTSMCLCVLGSGHTNVCIWVKVHIRVYWVCVGVYVSLPMPLSTCSWLRGTP